MITLTLMINWPGLPVQFRAFTGKSELDALNKILVYFNGDDIVELEDLDKATSPKKMLRLIEDYFSDGYDSIIIGKVVLYEATK
jgi:hypothetical protein